MNLKAWIPSYALMLVVFYFIQRVAGFEAAVISGLAWITAALMVADL